MSDRWTWAGRMVAWGFGVPKSSGSASVDGVEMCTFSCCLGCVLYLSLIGACLI
jgi:hypothetical protein